MTTPTEHAVEAWNALQKAEKKVRQREKELKLSLLHLDTNELNEYFKITEQFEYKDVK